MAYKIVWSKRSQREFDNIVKYLLENWSQHVFSNFLSEVDDKVILISDSHEIGTIVKKNRNKRSIIITPHTRLYYKIGKEKITIITLFDTRQNPKKLKKMGLAEPIIEYGETPNVIS